MPRNRLVILLALTVQATVTVQTTVNVPVFAQDSPGYTPDLIDVGDIYTPPPTQTVPTAQLPTGLGKVIFDVLGDNNPNTVNTTQLQFLKILDYGQKAMEAYRLGRELYTGVSRIIKDPSGVLKHDLQVLLQNYDKIGNPQSPSEQAQAGGSGSSDRIFADPENTYEVYVQAKNDVARRMLVPSLMQQLVFGEDAVALREQQGDQLEASLTNTIEAAQSLVQLSGATVQAVTNSGELAQSVGERSTQAQGLKSSQAVLKSINANQADGAGQAANNGTILGNIQLGQVEQNKSTLALVVGSTLAYQQRDVQNHQLASQNVFLEQIRADLGQQEDERQQEALSRLRKQRRITGNILVPGLVTTYTEPTP